MVTGMKSGVLLIIAADFAEAHLLAKANGLQPLPGNVRTIVKAEALRGWSHGTPAIIGRMADWPEGAQFNALAKAVEIARQRGHIRIADEADIEAIKIERMAAA